MSVFWNECKKAANPKLLAIIATFSAVFMLLFLEIVNYPAGGQGTNSPYDMPFAAEIIERVGASVPADDSSSLVAMWDEKVAELNEIIADDEFLQTAGVTDFQKLYDLWQGDDTEAEQAVQQYISNLLYGGGEFEKLYFEWQYVKNMVENVTGEVGIRYAGLSEDEARAQLARWEPLSKAYYNLMIKRFTSDTYSLLPEGAMHILQRDMSYLGILMLISALVLAVYMQVRERASSVLPLYATTKTGRKIFGLEFVACLFVTGVVGVLQLLAYLILLLMNGFSVFFACPAYAGNIPNYYGNLTYGGYVFLYCLVEFLFMLVSSAVAYLIGRASATYITGTAFGVAVGVALGALNAVLSMALFCAGEQSVLPFWQLYGLAGFILFCGLLIFWRLKRDRAGDL